MPVSSPEIIVGRIDDVSHPESTVARRSWPTVMKASGLTRGRCWRLVDVVKVRCHVRSGGKTDIAGESEDVGLTEADLKEDWDGKPHRMLASAG